MKWLFLKIYGTLRYYSKKTIIFILSTERRQRKIKSREIRERSKQQKKIIFEDLRTGNKLGEINLSIEEVNTVNLYFLGKFIPWSVAAEMCQRHRGYKISDNPEIYRKLSPKR